MEAMINGSGFFYTVSGPEGAKPVVLVHGFPFSSAMWTPQIEVLQNEFRVIAPDLRGHGKSEVGDGQYLIEHFADDLLGLLDALKLEKPVICGLSMGGYVILRALEKVPGRFGALVLADTRADADSNETKIKRAATVAAIKSTGLGPFCEGFLKAVFATESFARHPEAIEKIRRMIMAQDPLAVAGTLIAMAARTDSTALLPQIRMPTLVLCGRADVTTPPSCSEAMARAIPGAKLQLIEDAAHMSNLENPEVFNAALLDFLRTAT